MNPEAWVPPVPTYLGDEEQSELDAHFLEQTRWWPYGDGVALLSAFPADFQLDLLNTLVATACDFRAAVIREGIERIQDAITANDAIERRTVSAAMVHTLHYPSCEAWVRDTPLARALHGDT